MSVLASILLLLLGTILYFLADLHAVGAILMIVGAIAAVFGVLHLAILTRRGRRPPAQRE